MNDEKEKQQADQDAGKPKILAEPRAWWRLDPETRKTFNAVSGAVGSISGIITIAALFVHGNIAILLWSAGVDVAALAALLLVRLTGGRTVKINFEVKLQRVLSAASVVVIALGCWGILRLRFASTAARQRWAGSVAANGIRLTVRIADT
jgi:low temperature requirement protein LtrA